MERGGRGQRRCRPEAAGLNAERPARCLALERANPSAPSPKAQCAQGAPARQEGGYQPFFPFLQPPPQRPRGRSSVGGGCVAGAEAACAVRGVGVPAGWPRPPGPLPPRRGPGSILRATSAGRRRSGDPDLPTQWVGHGGNRPATPPRATPRRHPVGSPPPP